MPSSTAPGKRITGQDMQTYMESFAHQFLSRCIRYNEEVCRICYEADKDLPWAVHIQNKCSGERNTIRYARIVLCTGGCSTPFIPAALSIEAAKSANFNVPVIHSQQFGEHLDSLISVAKSAPPDRVIVVIGGGKSAQDVSACLALRGACVKIVFQKADALLAAPAPLPDAIRKSRFLSILSPYISLQTRLERFLHTTSLGSNIVHGIWGLISSSSYSALSIASDSPLRNAHSLFWDIRTNDEGAPRPDSFFSLVNAGKIELVSPARVQSYGRDGLVRLEDGRELLASAVVLCTGYESSWKDIFDEKATDYLDIYRHAPSSLSELETKAFEYKSLSSYSSYTGMKHEASVQRASHIYRGLVPAKILGRRNFAINGAVFTTNNGYTFEVSAHWISSYFLGDHFLLKNLPKSPEEAVTQTEIVAAYIRKRHPKMLLWANESYSGGIAFWNWPQYTDQLLEDMSLPSMRSGGNWLTWPFKVINIQEIKDLKEEREVLRAEKVLD